MSNGTHPLKVVFGETRGQLLASHSSMPHPQPGSDLAAELVNILRYAQTDPFENNLQRERFISSFNAILDRHQLRIDTGVDTLPCRLDFEYTKDENGAVGPHEICFKIPSGRLVGGFGRKKRIGLVDASARISSGRYDAASRARLIPLTDDSSSNRLS
ncbi:MAG: hypothetical protein AAF709_16800 [Pseudomonadota bacterium]